MKKVWNDADLVDLTIQATSKQGCQEGEKMSPPVFHPSGDTECNSSTNWKPGENTGRPGNH